LKEDERMLLTEGKKAREKAAAVKKWISINSSI
jgi:hypothetical protein